MLRNRATILFSLFFITTAVAQFDAFVQNLECVGNNLEFDLTVTEGFIPITLPHSGYEVFVRRDISNTGSVLLWQETGDPAKTLDAYPVSTDPGQGCPDISEIFVDIPTAGISNLFLRDLDDIPTLGQWGLICLGMLLVIFGVVMLREPNLSLALIEAERKH